MKRLLVALLIFQIIQFIYIMGQIQIVKDTVSNNANIANERAEAFAKALLDLREKINK